MVFIGLLSLSLILYMILDIIITHVMGDEKLGKVELNREKINTNVELT